MTRHFGILIPSTNRTVEIEFTRLIPESLQFHTARMGKGGDTPFSPSLDEDVAYQSKMLGNAKVEAISLIQTSASLFEDGYDERIKALITEHTGAPATRPQKPSARLQERSAPAKLRSCLPIPTR